MRETKIGLVMLMMTTIGQCWKQVAEDLGLNVEAPFNLILENGTTIEFDALVRDFGAPLGMLITTDFKKVEKIDLTKMGYGFSTMSHPAGNRGHDTASFKHVLKDWGWSGDPALVPAWLDEVPDPNPGNDYSDED